MLIIEFKIESGGVENFLKWMFWIKYKLQSYSRFNVCRISFENTFDYVHCPLSLEEYCAIESLFYFPTSPQTIRNHFLKQTIV